MCCCTDGEMREAPGMDQSPPAAVSSNAGQIDVFGLGQNHDLLQWTFSGTTNTWTVLAMSLDPGRWRSDVD